MVLMDAVLDDPKFPSKALEHNVKEKNRKYLAEATVAGLGNMPLVIDTTARKGLTELMLELISKTVFNFLKKS